MSPETTADTIGAVDGAVSGAGHEAEAGPLAVHVTGEGVGDACAEGELCAAGGDVVPQLASKSVAATARAAVRMLKRRTLTVQMMLRFARGIKGTVAQHPGAVQHWLRHLALRFG